MHVGVVGGSIVVMNIVGETRSGAVVVVSKNNAGRTALCSFYFIHYLG